MWRFFDDSDSDYSDYDDDVPIQPFAFAHPRHVVPVVNLPSLNVKSTVSNSENIARGLADEWKKRGRSCAAAALVYMCKNVVPEIQGRNKTCGFIAFKVAITALGYDFNVAQLVEYGKQQRITSIGDLNYVTYMQQLFKKFVNRVDTLIMGFPSSETLIDELMEGKMFLVPYVPSGSKEGAPGPRDGEDGHWALLCGVAMKVPDRNMPILSSLRKMSNELPIYVAKKFPSELRRYRESARVIAYHGWSTTPHFWKAEELRRSCKEICTMNQYGLQRSFPYGGFQIFDDQPSGAGGFDGMILRVDSDDF